MLHDLVLSGYGIMHTRNVGAVLEPDTQKPKKKTKATGGLVIDGSKSSYSIVVAQFLCLRPLTTRCLVY